MGTSLVVQWLRFCTLRAGNLGSISGGGTRPHLPQLRVGMLELKRACVPQLRLGAAKLKCPQGIFPIQDQTHISHIAGRFFYHLSHQGSLKIEKALGLSSKEGL